MWRKFTWLMFGACVSLLACPLERDSLHDQKRCQPSCSEPLTCYDGQCGPADGGLHDGPPIDSIQGEGIVDVDQGPDTTVDTTVDTLTKPDVSLDLPGPKADIDTGVDLAPADTLIDSTFDTLPTLDVTVDTVPPPDLTVDSISPDSIWVPQITGTVTTSASCTANPTSIFMTDDCRGGIAVFAFPCNVQTQQCSPVGNINVKLDGDLSAGKSYSYTIWGISPNNSSVSVYAYQADSVDLKSESQVLNHETQAQDLVGGTGTTLFSLTPGATAVKDFELFR